MSRSIKNKYRLAVPFYAGEAQYLHAEDAWAWAEKARPAEKRQTPVATFPGSDRDPDRDPDFANRTSVRCDPRQLSGRQADRPDMSLQRVDIVSLLEDT